MIEHHMFHLADATQMTVSKVSRSISSLNNWSMHEVINGRGWIATLKKSDGSG
jgi:hypothetical protein